MSASTCAFNSSSAGSYSVNFNGTGGLPPVTHQVRVFVAVNKASPTIATSLSAANVTVGGSASDSATLVGTAGGATGTVIYNLFSGGTCIGTPTVLSDVTVSNGMIPNSASRRFNSTGTFSWNAVYSGDSNNNLATSPCEFFLVTPVPPSRGFTISASVVSLIVEQGDAGRIIINLESSGFTGRVNLVVIVSPVNEHGVRTRISPTSLELHSNSFRKTLLQIITDEDTPVGNYTITVIGIVGSASRSVILTITVVNSSWMAENSCVMEAVNCNCLAKSSEDYSTIPSLSELGSGALDNSDNCTNRVLVGQVVC
jgi:hypothetical protein